MRLAHQIGYYSNVGRQGAALAGLIRIAFNHKPTPMTRFQHLRSLWRLLSAGYAALVAYLAIYLVSSGAPTRTQLLLAGGTVAAAIAAAMFTVWLGPDRLLALRRRLNRKPIPILYLLAAMLLLMAFGAELRPEWLHALIALALAATLILLYWTLFTTDAESAPPRLLIGLGLLALIAMLGLRLLGLEIYPPLHQVDEPWTFGWALSYARTGTLSDWLMIERDFEVYRFFALMGTWLRVVGEGWWQARAFNFLLSLIVAGLSALAARNLYGRSTALFTALVLLGSVVLASAAQVRHDIGLALATSASLWLFSVALKRDSRLLDLLAGAAIGFGLFAHTHAILFTPVFIFSLYAPLVVRGWKRDRRLPAGLWLYILGAAAAGIIALSLQPLSYSAEQSLGASPLAAGSILQAVLQHVANLAFLSKYELLLIAAALFGLLLRRTTADWSILLLVILGQAALGTSPSVTTSAYYQVPLTPVFGIAVASLCARGWSRVAARADHAAPMGAVVACLLVIAPNFGATAGPSVEHLVTGQSLRASIPEPAAWIRAHIPLGSTVVGEHHFFLWLTDYHFLSPQAPLFLSESHPLHDAGAEAVWDEVGVDVFIVDPQLSTYSLLEPLITSGYLERAGYAPAAQIGTSILYARGYNGEQNSAD